MKILIFLITLIHSKVYAFPQLCEGDTYKEFLPPQIRPLKIKQTSIYDFLQPKGIFGKYYVKQVCGSSHASGIYSAGRDVAINREVDEAVNWVDFKLDKDGNGTLTSHQSCQSQLISKISSEQKELQKSKRRGMAFGIFRELYGMVDEMNHFEDCNKTGRSQKTIPVLQQHQGIFGNGALKKFPANKGFYTARLKENGTINKECNFLYHVKFVSIQDQVSCIGYPDITLSEVHIYTLNKNSIYVTRTILRQKHNFNRDPVKNCPIPKK